jgi:dihydrofolate reductase
MRKVVGYLLMSLDGVIEDPSDWLELFDEVAGDNMVKVINAQDAVLLGRVQYQEWAAYWPAVPDEHPFSHFINHVHKYVVSTTLSSVDWQPATLIKGDVFQEIAQLKQQPGKNIGAHGSITLIHSLLEHNLLDELELLVFPVLAGRGRHLLAEENNRRQLKLISSKPTSTGALILSYQVVQP